MCDLALVMASHLTGKDGEVIDSEREFGRALMIISLFDVSRQWPMLPFCVYRLIQESTLSLHTAQIRDWILKTRSRDCVRHSRQERKTKSRSNNDGNETLTTL
jgi:hypothetical protein